jgi:2-polyprenyl-3-methyl-5-hydroxy-6-metoxy-1,4-benzoquinol methylase
MNLSSYSIEHKRAQLAKEGKLDQLRLLYTPKYPEIKDENTAPFWNERYRRRSPLAEQDGMTRDRVRITANFYPASTLPKSTVLDIGIGDGWLEEILELKNVQLYGNDISDIAIRNAKQRFKGEFNIQSIYHLKYDRLFDAIFLLEVLEHIPPSKTFKVLGDIYKLLKPHGYFILSVPTNEGLETMPNNPNSHLRMYTIPLIHAELEMAGFLVSQVKTLYAFPTHYALKKLLTRIWPNRWQPNNIIIQARKN